MNYLSLARRTVYVLMLLAGPSLFAANWPQWRGPEFNGSSSETGLPVTFSKTENVKWIAPLPGPASATTIVWEDHVFVSSTDRAAQTLVAIALDRSSGRELWRRKVSDGFGRDNRSNYASPSPVTDGERVIFYYGNGALAAFGFDGNSLWQRNIQEDEGVFAFQWTYSTSPLLHDGRLYIQVLQRDVPVNGRGRSDGPNDSYVLALDPATGKTLWKHIRPSDAKAESREAFTTPIPAKTASGSQLWVAGGDCITGHNPKTGEELWRWGTWNPTRIGHWRLVPSPVSADGIAIICAPKGDPVYAIKPTGQGVQDDSAIAWKGEEREVSSDVCTPLFYDGRLFILNGERKVISRIDPATGAPDWIGELGTRPKIECSPSGADGKIYFLDHNANVFVVSAGDEFKLLHQTPLGEAEDRDTRSAIAISSGNLFIRTTDKLYCVGE